MFFIFWLCFILIASESQQLHNHAEFDCDNPQYMLISNVKNTVTCLQYHTLGLRLKSGEKQGKLYYGCIWWVEVWGLLSFNLVQDAITLDCFLRQNNSFSFSKKKLFLPPKTILTLKKNTLHIQNNPFPSYPPVLNENIWIAPYHRKNILLWIIQCAEIKKSFFSVNNIEIKKNSKHKFSLILDFKYLYNSLWLFQINS